MKENTEKSASETSQENEGLKSCPTWELYQYEWKDLRGGHAAKIEMHWDYAGHAFKSRQPEIDSLKSELTSLRAELLKAHADNAAIKKELARYDGLEIATGNAFDEVVDQVDRLSVKLQKAQAACAAADELLTYIPPSYVERALAAYEEAKK